MARARTGALIIVAALAFAAVGVGSAPASSAAVQEGCAADDTTSTVTCTYRGDPGSAFDFVAPAGVTSVHLDVVGRPGDFAFSSGQSSWAGEGIPAVVTADVSTYGGEVLRIEFRDNGGHGGPGAGNGGGSTAVLRAGGLLVAEAGGGGGAGQPGGTICDSGSLEGTSCGYSSGGDAGTSGADGYTLGEPGHDITPARGGASGPSGGAGGAGAVADVDTPTPFPFDSGDPGTSTRGGSGGTGEFGGGGGGGGSVGGGGGGAGGTGNFTRSYGAGGGGGSSTVPAGGTLGLAPEYAVARITYELGGVTRVQPTELDFGNVLVGTTSEAQAVTISNPGPGPVAFNVGVDAPFDLDGDDCPDGILGEGMSCRIRVVFRPSSVGQASGSLTIWDSSGGQPRVVTLTGVGARPIATASPSTVSFGSQDIGSDTERVVTLDNTGNGDLVVGTTALSASGTFSIASDSCAGATVPPAGSCTVTLAFRPQDNADFSTTLRINHNASGGSTTVGVTGSGIPPADLAVRGVGTLYTGQDHLVTRAVASPGSTQSYPVEIANDDATARAFWIHPVSDGRPASVQVRPAGIGPALTPNANGDYLVGPVKPGQTVKYSLQVTPGGEGTGASRVRVILEAYQGQPIETVTTETNIAAATHGFTRFELFAKRGSQPFIGGPTNGQTTTGPALSTGASAAYTVRLRNDGSGPAQIGLHLSDSDGCAGSFTVAATTGTRSVTADVYAGSFVTRMLQPGGYQDVRVTVRRATTGCPAKLIRAESLDGSTVVRTSYLLANAAYAPATD